MASTAQVQSIGGGGGLSLAAELAVQQSVVFPAGRLQSVWNNDLGAPTYIGGPGFAIGSFDISQDGAQLASSLLQQWNFLGIDDPWVELRLLRDTSSVSQRTLVFQQTSGGIPVHQSRIILTFSTTGSFLYYGGRYVPADKQSGWGFASTCGQLLGTADQLGWSIIECRPLFYLPDDVLQDPNGGMTLMPVFALESMAPWGEVRRLFLSDIDFTFFSRRDNNVVADRRVQKWFEDDTHDPDWYDYRWNSACVWVGGACTDSDADRLSAQLWDYAVHMADWHERYSYDGQPSGLGDDYRIRVEPGSAAWSWGHRVAYLDPNVRLSVMTHEFTHAVTGTEAPGHSGELSEGLSDAYAVIIQRETDHWCYHNYPGDYVNQPENDETHVDNSRCQMLARDTVGDVPEWEVSTVKPLVPGIMYNYFANDGHLSGTLYGKVFNLLQVQQWEDPVLGPQTYYNGLPIAGEVTFQKTGDLFYRFVQYHLGAVGLQPWNDFGPHFIQAAWLAYLAGDLTKTEYMKGIHALYAVGHRQSPLTITGYLGSRYRPAAIWKNSQIYLFYVDYNDRLTYQRRASGVWTSPVSFASGAAVSDTGLEAYSLPDGEARVLYRLPGEEELYFAKILSSGTVPDYVWSFSNAYGYHIPAAYAPSGYHDGREEYIFAATWEKGFTVTRLSDCKVFEYPNIQLGGVSVTQYQGKVYVTGVEGDPSNPRYKHMVTRLWANEQLQDLGFAPDWGYTTCENYTHPDGCFGHKISTASAPVLLGVTMPADRKDFERMYVAYPWDHDRFAITRFHVDVDRQNTPTRRTRMLPVMSGDNHFVTEVELLQSNGYIFAFEGGLMHVIRIY